MIDRPLTDEEKIKRRDFNTAEILRRRNGTAPAFVEPGADPPPGRRLRTTDLGSCPDCDTPYGKYRRCYTCKPSTGPKGPRPKRATGDHLRDATKKVREPRPANGPAMTTHSEPDPGARPPIDGPAPIPETPAPIVGYTPPAPEIFVPARTIDVTLPASSHSHPAPASAVGTIRAIVQLLSSLPDDDAAWVCESAYALSRRSRP